MYRFKSLRLRHFVHYAGFAGFGIGAIFSQIQTQQRVRLFHGMRKVDYVGWFEIIRWNVNMLQHIALGWVTTW